MPAPINIQQPRWHIVGWIIATILVANAAVGVLPFAPFEGDDQGMVNGLREILLGPAGFPSLVYVYELQPGAYRLVLGLHALTHLDVGTLYFGASAAGAAGFVLFSAWLGRRLLGMSFGWCLAMTALAQELFTAAAYANTNNLGGCFVLLGILVLELRPHRGGCVAAAMLIALGGWCRIDAFAIAPLALVVLARHLPLARAMRWTLATAVATVMIFCALLWASDDTPLAIWRFFSSQPKNALGLFHTLQWLYLLHSATGLILALVGVVWATARKDFWLPASFVVVFIPLFAIHGQNFYSTKYFSYGVPILTWSALWTLHRLYEIAGAPRPHSAWRRRLARAALASAVAAMALEYTTSIRRVENPERLWPLPTGVPLAVFSGGSKAALVWTLGPGELIPGADGFRMRTGYGFSPWLWHIEKCKVLVECSRLRQLLSGCDRATVITSTYLAHQIVVSLARAQGLKPGPPSHPDTTNTSTEERMWQDGLRRFEIFLVNHTQYRFAEFHEIVAAPLATPVYFANDSGRIYADELFANDSQPWRLLSAQADGTFTIYQRAVHD
jgi:hypothetical protein